MGAYVQEADIAVEHWQVLGDVWEELEIAQPDTANARAEVAAICALRLNFQMPMLLDDMDNQADLKHACPSRAAVRDRSIRHRHLPLEGLGAVRIHAGRVA